VLHGLSKVLQCVSVARRVFSSQRTFDGLTSRYLQGSVSVYTYNDRVCERERARADAKEREEKKQ
jgi:hypothetical protein